MTADALARYCEMIAKAREIWPSDVLIKDMQTWAAGALQNAEQNSTVDAQLGRCMTCWDEAGNFLPQHAKAMVGDSVGELPATFVAQEGSELEKAFMKLAGGTIAAAKKGPGADWMGIVRVLDFLAKHLRPGVGLEYENWSKGLRVTFTSQEAMEKYAAKRRTEDEVIAYEDDGLELAKALNGQKVEFNKVFNTMGKHPEEVDTWFGPHAVKLSKFVDAVQGALCNTALAAVEAKVGGGVVWVYALLYYSANLCCTDCAAEVGLMIRDGVYPYPIRLPSSHQLHSGVPRASHGITTSLTTVHLRIASTFLRTSSACPTTT